MTPKLSIIIVNYRSSDALEHCLRSLNVATSVALEIMLVDNSADDGAKEVLKHSGFHGHYFPQSENIGYTKAANHGARHAHGEFLCFLNPDTILESQSLDRLLAWVQQHSRTVAGPRELNATGRIVTTAFSYVTRRYIWGANLVYKFPWPRSWHPWLGWLVPPFHLASKCRTSHEPFSAPVLSGSCLVMSRAVWETVGAWNENLTYFGLESEWFKRARAHGVTAWYVPEAVVYHEHALSIKRAEHWRVREEADRNRRWHARGFGIITLAILVAVLWLENRVRSLQE